MIKPLYLLADSQLLFGESGVARRIRAELPQNSDVKAAYIGASNDDLPEFYDLFVAAMELMEITQCRMVPSLLSPEDRAFLNAADLILLAGGDVERGWASFEQNGVKDLIPRKRLEGATLLGISAGAVQFGMGSLSSAPQPKKVEMFRFAPFYVSAHDEKNDWWDLRALVRLSQPGIRGIGIPAGGGAVYWPDGTLEPLRRPLTELVKEDDQIREQLLMPS
ncbi:MAG TPA: Type 1 glutamine amidotransferase-like domain-containing protein, partial [Candidatus Sulfotelmatobacter sp.]|nr:Type 1 glutamine amidotransferase-like domain-containing protein [Candidatus Sulfotelmatobacter sp.]